MLTTGKWGVCVCKYTYFMVFYHLALPWAMCTSAEPPVLSKPLTCCLLSAVTPRGVAVLSLRTYAGTSVRARCLGAASRAEPAPGASPAQPRQGSPQQTLAQELCAGVQEGGFCASLFKCGAGQFFGRGFRRGFRRPCAPSLAPISPGTDVAAAAGLGTVHPPRARRS